MKPKGFFYGIYSEDNGWNETGKGRKLAVVMEDHTVLICFYEEGAGVIRCNDFGYILTDAQVEPINRLIGLT